MNLSTRLFSTRLFSVRQFSVRLPGGPISGARAPALAASMLVACAIAGCGGSPSPDARYPAREVGCPVKSYPGQPPAPVDELGVATIECTSGAGTCSRQLLDAVCARGGDVAWGLGDNSLTSGHLTVHAAHTRRVTQGPREAGCAVQVLDDPPTMRTENIGPVVAICDQYDSRDACLRELEDQTCQLGGDVLWQVDGPVPDGNKQRMRGRAAHTR